MYAAGLGLMEQSDFPLCRVPARWHCSAQSPSLPKHPAPPITPSLPTVASAHPPRTAHPAHLSSGRSEEHTSELQSLMRLSYAVFCLKKKNNTNLYTHS